MKGDAMNRAAWLAKRWLGRMGWFGGAGAGLLVFAAVFCGSGMTWRIEERDALKAQAEQLHARYRMAQARPDAIPPGRERQLHAFYGFFPSPSSLPDWLTQISAAARRRGLSLDQGEYRMVQERGARVARYQVTLPVKGNYGQIRGFIGEVLQEIPASGLEDVSFKRDTIGSATLEARIKVNLYLSVPG